MNFKDYIMVFCIGLAVVLILVLFFIFSENKQNYNFIKDYFETEKIKSKEDPAKQYHDKCLLARQVYQWSWYKKLSTKAGKLNLKKYYAMSLKEFNDLIELSHRLNKYIGIGEDKRYLMLSKWIFESSINMNAEHKTGEIIKLTGYTPSGFKIALYYYKYKLNIDSGSPLYIRELYNRHPDHKAIFSKWENCIKFDYAYIWYLKQKFRGRWDKILTAFHWGEWIVDQWTIKGLEMIPNYRIDKKHGLWIRSYYQTIFEMAYGIQTGNYHQISKYSKVIGKFKKSNKYRAAYIKTLQIKFKKKEKFESLEKKFENVKNEFNDYKKLHLELIQRMNQLNDINYDIRVNKYKRKFTEYQIKLKSNIISIEKEIRKFTKDKIFK